MLGASLTVDGVITLDVVRRGSPRNSEVLRINSTAVPDFLGIGMSHLTYKVEK